MHPTQYFECVNLLQVEYKSRTIWRGNWPRTRVSRGDSTDAWVVASPQEVVEGFAARLSLTLQQAGATEYALPPRVTTGFWDRRFRGG